MFSLPPEWKHWSTESTQRIFEWEILKCLYLTAQRQEDPNGGFLFPKLTTFQNMYMLLPIKDVKLKGIFKIINTIIHLWTFVAKKKLNCLSTYSIENIVKM